jgi:hypothetical protein
MNKSSQLLAPRASRSKRTRKICPCISTSMRDAPAQDSSRSGQESSTGQSGIPQRTAMWVSLACVPVSLVATLEADQEGLKSSCPNGNGLRPTHPPMCSWNDLYDGASSEGYFSPDCSSSRSSRSPESESRLLDLYYRDEFRVYVAR